MNREEFIYFNKKLSRHKPRLVMGPTGIGKSAIIAELAASLKLDLVPLPLSVLDPPDLIGLPNIKNDQTVYATPWWWPKGPAVLLLEEIDFCDPDLQGPAMLLALERQIAGNKIHEDTIVIATGNGKKYKRQDIDQALIRRFAVIDYRPTVDEWLDWASKQKNFSKSIIDYIKLHPEALDTPLELIGKPGQTIPCRASWSDLARFLYDLPDDKTSRIELWAASFIGSKSAKDFALWFSLHKKTLLAEAIYLGRVSPKEYSPVDIANISAYIADGILKRDKKSQENALNFYAEAGPEQFACLFNRLPKEAAPIVASVKKASSLADELMRIAFK